MQVSSFGRLRETVTDSEHGEDVLRPAGPWLDLPPDVLDVGVDRPLVRLEGHAFDRVEQLRIWNSVFVRSTR